MLSPLKPQPLQLNVGRFAYTLAVIVVFILVVAVAWFAVSQILMVVQVTGRSVAIQLGTATESYVAADQFFTLLFGGSLVVAFFALAVWVYQYSQRQAYLGGG